MISIVVAYFDRRNLFIETLKSISRSAYKDFEVIAVDDKSNERIDDLQKRFKFLRVVRIEDKWYHNSCIPFNRGINEAKGDIIILQNPECYHKDDILSYAAENVNNSNYISMSCYAINKDMTDDFRRTLNDFDNLPQQFVADYIGWYNHPKYRPVHYHFCAGITKRNLNILGGFDERYAMGVGYEDSEFVDRVKRLRLNMIIADKVVIHQWHPKVYDLINKDHFDLYAMNGLLHRKTKKELIIRANG